DHAQFAFVNLSGNVLTPVNALADGRTRTSIQPITLDTASINYASNRGLSHKVFTHLSYNWMPCEDYTPFIGIGASAEFGQSCKNRDCDDRRQCNNVCTPKTACNDDVDGSCVTCALSQWAVWIKGGVLFN